MTSDIVTVRHETRLQKQNDCILRGGRAVRDLIDTFEHTIEVSPNLILAADALRGIPMAGIVRDGRAVVRSAMRDGWYRSSHSGRKHWSVIQPPFDGDRFAQCCQYWAWCQRRLMELAAPIFRLEDLNYSTSERGRLLSFCHIAGPPRNMPFPRSGRDRPGRLKFALLGAEDPGDWTDWSAYRRDVFDHYSGATMDVLYPGWRRAWIKVS